jgi:hypothetical protein
MIGMMKLFRLERRTSGGVDLIAGNLTEVEMVVAATTRANVCFYNR